MQRRSDRKRDLARSDAVAEREETRLRQLRELRHRDVNEHDAVRFSESVAVHVTAVVPIGNVSPDAGEHDTLTEPWPSVAGGVSKLTGHAARVDRRARNALDARQRRRIGDRRRRWRRRRSRCGRAAARRAETPASLPSRRDSQTATRLH